MAGACATISARQPETHLGKTGAVVSADAPSANDQNSAQHVKNFLKNTEPNAYFGLESSLPYFHASEKQFLNRPRHKCHIRIAPEFKSIGQELPIRKPTRNTSAPPKPTCSNAEVSGVSMYLCRIQEIEPNSTHTTVRAIVVAV